MATKKKPAVAAEGDKTYEVLSPLDHDGLRYEIGEPIVMDEATAAGLLAANVIKPAAEA